MKTHRRSFVVGALAATALAACTPPAQEAQTPDPAASTAPDPADTIRPLYDPYLTEGAQFPGLEQQAPWSAAMLTALQAMMARSQAAGEPILDFDPLIDAQDYQLTDLNVTTDSVVENSHATARASFNNGGAPVEVVYDLVWENGGWRVDNVRTSRWDLRAIVAG
ncbi:MAG: hypothetical protein DCF16_03860 [Alphaproteobacteria bacterium]|nr:MAG: hypothetical protein DCF16_03860 [Alphaproteobacteria bacterium]